MLTTRTGLSTALRETAAAHWVSLSPALSSVTIVKSNPGIATARPDYDDVVHQLEHDGLVTFRATWAALPETLQRKLAATRRGGGNEDDPT